MLQTCTSWMRGPNSDVWLLYPNMLVFQYVWKYIIFVIGRLLPGSLSLSHTCGLKSPTSYEIAYDIHSYHESAISQAGDMTKNDHIAPQH